MSDTSRGATFDLAALVEPTPVETFLAGSWQRAPLHQQRRDAGYYDAVLTGDALDDLLNASDWRHPALQLAKDGTYYAAEAYSRNVKHGSEVFSGVVDMEKVRTEYRSGATIVLPAIHRAWAPLRAVCESIEAELSHAVHANAYLTPGGATGFTPHYDAHDVFVMQIAGRKRWRVYPPPIVLPHHTQPFSPSGYTPGAPILERELVAGDLLYLPRGYVHSASTSDEHSLHVTLGVTMFTWVELLNEVVQACKTVPTSREALPVGFARREDLLPILAAGLRDRLAALPAQTEPAKTVEAFLARVRTARPRAMPQFVSAVTVTGWQSELEAPPPERFAISTENGRTMLAFQGRKLVLPLEVRSTLESIGQRSRFRPSDLPRDLDEQAILAFVRFLEGEGFLRRAR